MNNLVLYQAITFLYEFDAHTPEKGAGLARLVD